MTPVADESVACAPFAWDAAAWADSVEDRCPEPFDCLLVLAGGVDEAGAVHATARTHACALGLHVCV